jgi:hypothetical protein
MLRRGELGTGDESSEPAHAVTDEGDALRIDAMVRRKTRFADRLHDRPNIFDHMNKGERTAASQGAAVVKEAEKTGRLLIYGWRIDRAPSVAPDCARLA